jgi:hypothetical protein
MKERPILFSGPMVRAILDGRKTQTRRPVKPQPFVATPSMFDTSKCPLGQPGDRLWVRETWRTGYLFGMPRGQERQIPIYRADGISIYPAGVEINFLWRPSIHMPRWASRITLEITRVWVEMVQDITEEGAIREGMVPLDRSSPSEMFRDTWECIYGTWDANPFVWAVEFRRVE